MDFARRHNYWRGMPDAQTSTLPFFPFPKAEGKNNYFQNEENKKMKEKRKMADGEGKKRIGSFKNFVAGLLMFAVAVAGVAVSTPANAEVVTTDGTTFQGSDLMNLIVVSELLDNGNLGISGNSNLRDLIVLDALSQGNLNLGSGNLSNLIILEGLTNNGSFGSGNLRDLILLDAVSGQGGINVGSGNLKDLIILDALFN